MAWATSWSQGRCREFCHWSLTAFTTQTSGLWESACNKDCQAAARPPRGKEAQRSGVSFTPTKPGVCQLKRILLTFWENTRAVLPCKRWKTNLSYQPALLIFPNGVSVLKFAVICWNILCHKTLHVVNFVTIFSEKIQIQANCISSSSSASHLKPVWTKTMEEVFSLSAKDFICIQCV